MIRLRRLPLLIALLALILGLMAINRPTVVKAGELILVFAGLS